jgi:hypothetical protein
VLYRGGVKAPVATAVNDVAVTFAAAVTEVMHVHLALTGVPSEMRVSWVTGKVCVCHMYYDNIYFLYKAYKCYQEYKLCQ